MNARTTRTTRSRTTTSGERAHAALAAALTDRDRWIARMLAEHRVLTTHHLHALAFAHTTVRRAQQRLRALEHLGLIDGFRPRTATGSTPRHWVLSRLGEAVLAAEDGHPHPPPADPRSVARGLALAHNRQLAHQLATNTALTTLATHTGPTGTDPTGRLTLWWGQARCARRFPQARPDAFAIWHTPHPDHHDREHHNLEHPGGAGSGQEAGGAAGSAAGRGWGFFLEYDLGSETLAQLGGKLSGYLRLSITSAVATPVLFYLPGPTRERHARAALTHALAALAQDPTSLAGLDPAQALPIATAHPDPHRADRGWHPHARIWTPLTPWPSPPRSASAPAPAPGSTVSLERLLTHRPGAPAAPHHRDLNQPSDVEPSIEARPRMGVELGIESGPRPDTRLGAYRRGFAPAAELTAPDPTPPPPR